MQILKKKKETTTGYNYTLLKMPAIYLRVSSADKDLEEMEFIHCW